MNERELYKRAFSAIDDRPEINMDTLMEKRRANQKTTLKKTVFTACLFSFLFLGSNAITYAKTGEAWIAKVLKLTTGNGVEVTVKDYETNDPNVARSEVTINTDQQKDYCYEKDGRLIFDFNGETKDITDICNEKSYYQYEYTDENGFRHLIIAGGGVEEPGWAEYIFDQEGICTFNLYSDSILDQIELKTDQAGGVVKVNEIKTENEADGLEYVYVYEENDPLPETPDLPEWLEKAEEELMIGEI